MTEKKSWLKKTSRERTVQIWHLICMGIGIIACLVALFLWKDYFFAQHKYSGEAVLVSVDESMHTRLKNKNDTNYSKTDKYETYYTYKLTWQISNPDSEKSYRFVTQDEKTYAGAHPYGEKQTVFVYYNEDEADYKMVDYSSSLIIALVGLGLIVFPVIDILRVEERKKRILERDRKAAAQRAAKIPDNQP